MTQSSSPLPKPPQGRWRTASAKLAIVSSAIGLMAPPKRKAPAAAALLQLRARTLADLRTTSPRSARRGSRKAILLAMTRDRQGVLPRLADRRRRGVHGLRSFVAARKQPPGAALRRRDLGRHAILTWKVLDLEFGREVEATQLLGSGQVADRRRTLSVCQRQPLSL